MLREPTYTKLSRSQSRREEGGQRGPREGEGKSVSPGELREFQFGKMKKVLERVVVMAAHGVNVLAAAELCT